jgi:hypothetical protein
VTITDRRGTCSGGRPAALARPGLSVLAIRKAFGDDTAAFKSLTKLPSPSKGAFMRLVFNSPTQRKVVFWLGVGQSEYPR